LINLHLPSASQRPPRCSVLRMPLIRWSFFLSTTYRVSDMI
jgi:hypothetical protein